MTPHLEAKEGDVADRVLLPGDPLRAKFIAETYLTDPVCYNQVRGMLGYTGTYKGKRVSVQGTGMGIPSISIYVHELMEFYGVLAAEMETAALYTIAAKFKTHALSLLTVSDNIVTDEKTTPEERQVTFRAMMELALDSI